MAGRRDAEGAESLLEDDWHRHFPYQTMSVRLGADAAASPLPTRLPAG
jgi:hypothetical protein